MFTFVLYLNDDFSGGATRFCPLSDWIDGIFLINSLPDTPLCPDPTSPRDVRPKTGSLLVFRQQELRHSGVTVTGDGKKYILHGMVMYHDAYSFIHFSYSSSLMLLLILMATRPGKKSSPQALKYHTRC